MITSTGRNRTVRSENNQTVALAVKNVDENENLAAVIIIFRVEGNIVPWKRKKLARLILMTILCSGSVSIIKGKKKNINMPILSKEAFSNHIQFVLEPSPFQRRTWVQKAAVLYSYSTNLNTKDRSFQGIESMNIFKKYFKLEWGIEAVNILHDNFHGICSSSFLWALKIFWKKPGN